LRAVKRQKNRRKRWLLSQRIRQKTKKFGKGENIATITKPQNNSNDFEELLDEYEQIRPHRGQIVQGEILELTEDTVLLDVGAKRDGVVPTRELASLDEILFKDLSIGDHLPVFVTGTSSFDDELLVSIEKGLVLQDWQRAESCLASGEALELKVNGYNRGGLLLEFGRLDGFVPNSLIPGMPRGLGQNEKQTRKIRLIGSTLQAVVIEVDRNNKRLILSGKAAESIRRKERIQELESGERISGTVSNVVDFGAFVDLDGVDGLIHRSRLSWNGDEVEVLVRDVDTERERITLDRRALLPNPWNEFSQQHHDGDILEGKVVSVREFGAFVQLTEQITGLLHVSEFLPGLPPEPEKALSPGDELLVKIIEIDPEQQRVGLSMHRLPQDEIATE